MRTHDLELCQNSWPKRIYIFSIHLVLLDFLCVCSCGGSYWTYLLKMVKTRKGRDGAVAQGQDGAAEEGEDQEFVSMVTVRELLKVQESALKAVKGVKSI